MECHSRELVGKLEKQAKIIRRLVIQMITRAQSGHPGGSLSATDLLTALYFHQLRINPQDPDWPDRDRFLLSKGHAAPAWYATLAERGFFPRETLWTLRQWGSILQGHPDRTKTPGVEMSSGPLGQGLSVANGMALGARLMGRDFYTYVLLGNGELDEGQIWEAAMAAAHFHIDNLTAIVDYNGLQLDGPVAEIMGLEPLGEKWTAFGWQVIETDGHDMKAILEALDEAYSRRGTGKPTVIIAHTIKGKGVSFMEGVVGYHGKPPTLEEAEQALAELAQEDAHGR